jgi:hypothetical protein
MRFVFICQAYFASGSRVIEEALITTAAFGVLDMVYIRDD